MGLSYLGPVDGHDLVALQQALTRARDLHRPVVVQVETIKGKGYEFAEQDPRAYHGVSRFDANRGLHDPDISPAAGNFSAVFGEELTRLGISDERICAITAAMKLGTGLDDFSRQCGRRFFDVGIAEEHAVTFAAGLATKGYLPVFAVYSTFLQRTFDQILHDAALERTHIVLAVDRAGIVGDDGDTHQGVFDLPLLTGIPGTAVYSPWQYDQLRADLKKALYDDTGVVAVRYPRGAEPAAPLVDPSLDEVLLPGSDALTVLSYGRTAAALHQAVDGMTDPPETILLNKVWPLSDSLIAGLSRKKKILVFEESVRSGSLSEHLLMRLSDAGFVGDFEAVTLPDGFIRQCKVENALDRFGLSAEAIRRKIDAEKEEIR